MPTRIQRGASRAHQGTCPPASGIPHAVCPCGCGAVFQHRNGLRKLVCEKIWFALPEAVREKFYSGRGTPEERRAATREIFRLAHQVRDARGATAARPTAKRERAAA